MKERNRRDYIEYKQVKKKRRGKTILVTVEVDEPKKKKKRKRGDAKNVSRKLARELKSNIQICEECGSTSNLQVHHIDKDALNNSLENLLKLCLPCHMLAHINDPVYRIMKKRLKELQ